MAVLPRLVDESMVRVAPTVSLPVSSKMASVLLKVTPDRFMPLLLSMWAWFLFAPNVMLLPDVKEVALSTVRVVVPVAFTFEL